MARIEPSRHPSVISVTTSPGWAGGRVAAALHVVLAAEGRYAGSREAHLPGRQGEIQEGMRIGGAIDVLGDAHAPNQTGAGEGRARIPSRGLGDSVGRHAGDALRIVE